MQDVSITASISKYAQRGALLLVLSIVVPAAWSQSFGPANSYPTVPNSYANRVVLADMNSDGRVDIVTVDNGSATVSVLPGQGNGHFSSPSSYSTGTNASGSSYQPSSLAVGDVNADGRLDIVIGSFYTDMVGVMLGQAGNIFAPIVYYSTGQQAGVVRHLVLSDLNHDGRPDIVTANDYSAVGVLLGQPGGIFAPVVSYITSTAGQPRNLAIGDVNTDGQPDIVTANISGQYVGLLIGQAGGTFAPAVALYVGIGSGTYGVALSDVNSDGQLDIVLSNATDSVVGVMLGLGNGTFAATVIYSSGQYSEPYGVVLRDVNGDGRLDIITANVGSISAGVLLGQVGGSFAAAVRFPIHNNGPGPIEVAVGDVNGDGRPDIVSPNYASVDVLLNIGTYTPLATACPAADLALAPNPARDGFVVTLPPGLAPAQAELLNNLGQVVRRLSVGTTTNFRFETSGLAPGLYILRLQTGGAALARRVVVE